MGGWNSIIEMEEKLTLDELYLLVEAMYRKEHRHNRFVAAMQGVKLDELEKDDRFDKVQQQVMADAAGKSRERYVFEDVIGIEFEDDDD